MKNILILLISLFLCNNIYSQKYFSKLFDVNNEWEILNECSFDEQKNLILLGQSVNFFVNDSSKLGKIFILKLDNNYTVIDKIDIRESDQKYTLGTFVKNLKNKIVYGKSDTTGKDLYGSYFLSTVNNKFKISNIVQLKFYPNTFRTNGDTYYINNKLYFFCADYTTFVASKLKLSIQCMDTNGNLLWGKVFQDKRCYTNNVVQTKDGNFLLAGLKYYGEGPGGDDSAFAWYAKVDTLGSILWEKVLDRNSELMTVATAMTKADNDYFLTGSQASNYERRFESVYGDTSFCFMAKINEQTGGIVWQKRFLYNVNKIRGLNNGFGNFIVYKNGYLYALISHKVNTPNEEYVMFAKFDLQGNILWKRLFQQATYSNRFYSLTPIDDGFLICGDAKDSTKAKGDSDAWLIKTDSNGCIIPGCNAEVGIVQIINPEKVFTVYPNPAQNEINVSTENLDVKIESLAVYNMQGQALKTVSKTSKINTEDLANGNYLLIITTNKQQMAGKKFVVER